MAFEFKSESDKWACINALTLAAEKYDANADVCAKMHGMAPLARTFTNQAQVARRIANEIADS
jgi:hypothetical protein